MKARLLKENLRVYQAIQNSTAIDPNTIPRSYLHATVMNESGHNILHLAAANNRLDILKCYPLYFLESTIQNSNGLTPFETALHHHSLDAIKLFCERIDCNYSTLYTTKTPLFSALINLGNLEIIKFIFTKIKPQNLEAKLIETLERLDPPSVPKMMQFKNFLGQPYRRLVLGTTIERYALVNKHLEPWFLYTIAEHFNQNPTVAMQKTLSAFILRCLQTSDENLQLRLQILLFSLQETERKNLLSNLELAPNEQPLLEITIAIGLLEPGYYSTLSEATLQSLIANIKNPKIKQSLAIMHFQKTDFHSLPPNIIQIFYQIITTENLQRCAEYRAHPLLNLFLSQRMIRARVPWTLLQGRGSDISLKTSLLLLYFVRERLEERVTIQQKLKQVLGLNRELTYKEQEEKFNTLRIQTQELNSYEIITLNNFLSEQTQLESYDNPSPWLNTLKAMMLFPVNDFVLPYYYIQYLQNSDTITLCQALSQAEITTQIKYIRAASISHITKLVEFCLRESTNTDSEAAEPFRKLLTSLIHLCSYESPSLLMTIKTELGAEDMGLLKSPALKQMALQILSEPQSSRRLGLGPKKLSTQVPTQVYSGIWIQRLLSSINFIAAADCEIIEQLLDRYRFISLSLKQEELASLSSYQTFLNRINKFISSATEQRQYWLRKRESLLKFRADDAIREMLVQLEDLCNTHLYGSQGTLAKQAKKVLSEYYVKSMGSTRTSSIAKFSHWIYKHTIWNKGDITIAHSVIQSWLKKHLYHHHFIQIELERKSHNGILYNRQGTEVGFMDENLEAIGFVDNKPYPLTHIPEIKVGDVFYDKHGDILGILTAENTIKINNVFQQETNIDILKTLPLETLTTSRSACKLLTYNLLVENKLTHLFTQVKDPERQTFVEKLILDTLCDIKKPLNAGVFTALVARCAPQQLIPLLNNMPNNANRRHLFHACSKNSSYLLAFSQEDKRTEWFKFLQNHNPKELFAECLTNTYSQTDLQSLLVAFGIYSPFSLVGDGSGLSSSSLPPSGEESGEIALIKTIFQDKTTMDIVFKYYLTNQEHINKFLAAINKENFVHLIDQLNKASVDVNDPRFRLFQIAFYSQQNRLFPNMEVRYAKNHSWQYQDLKKLIKFYHKWKALTRNHPPASGRGEPNELFNIIIYRAANHGLIELFYPDGYFDPWLLTKSLVQSMQNLQRKNPDEELVVDWQKIAINTASLSPLKAFLLNYSGETNALKRFIKDVVTNSAIQAHPEILSGMNEIMNTHPDRQISRGIFSALEEVFIARPELMTVEFIKSLGHYIQRISDQRTLETDHKNIRSLTLATLITHFGKQKHYQTVITICERLPKNDDLKEIRKLAHRERYLQSIQEKWYFRIIKWFLRPGFFSNPPSPSWLTYCDGTIAYNPKIIIPPMITTSLKSGREISEELALRANLPKFKQMRERLTKLGSFFKPDNSDTDRRDLVSDQLAQNQR